MSTLKTTNIAHPSSASNNIVLDSSGGVDMDAFTVSGSAPADSVNLDASGRLLVGTSSARTAGNHTGRFQLEGTNFNDATASITYNANDGDCGYLHFVKTRSGNTVVQNGDGLGALKFFGTDGSTTLFAAGIRAEVDGTPGTNDMPGRLVFSTCPDGSASPVERMRITSGNANGANFLFNCTSNPSSSVKGSAILPNGSAGNYYATACSITSACSHFEFYNPNGSVGSIQTSSSSTAYITSSDYRLKENVVPLTGAANRLNQLQVHRFNFIADPDTTVDGFLAHEAQAVVPECVIGEKDAVNEDGSIKPQGIDQSKLVPLLTAALQEALAEIESLKARVTALEP